MLVNCNCDSDSEHYSNVIATIYVRACTTQGSWLRMANFTTSNFVRRHNSEDRRNNETLNYIRT